MHFFLNDRGSERTSDLLDSGKTRSPAARKALARVSSVVIALGTVSIFTDIASESVAVSLPLCITCAMGLSTITHGFIYGLHQAVQAFVRFGGGWAADRADRPKWIASTANSLSNIAEIQLLFASGFASIIAVVAVVAAVAADRIGRSTRRASQDSLITASSELADLGHSFGLPRMLDTIGAAFWSLLAFLVLFFLPTGYTIFFVISVTFAALGVIMLRLLGLDKRSRRKRAMALTPAPSRWRDLNDSPLPRRTTVAGPLAPLTIGDRFVYLPLQVRREFTAQWLHLLNVGTNLAFFLFTISLGRVADRFGHSWVFVVSRVALVVTSTCLGVFWFAIARGTYVLIVASALLLVLLGGAIIYEVVAISGYHARISALSKVSTTTAAIASGSLRIVARKTAAGKGCWLLASVTLGNLKSTRMVSTTPCDHVYKTGKYKMSLRIDHGVVTAFAANVRDKTGKKRHLWALPGLPSRTRISPDSQLFSFPALVTREVHVRAGVGVATRISLRAGHDYGNLATGVEKHIPDRRGIDDQVRWIGDSTLLCSARRDSTAGACDIWSSPMSNAAAPKLFIERAWSPSVAN